MNNLNQYLQAIVDKCTNGDVDKMLDEAARFLAEYGRGELDSEHGKSKYFQVYYDMIPLDKSLEKANEEVRKALEEIKSLRQEINNLRGDERKKVQMELSQAYANHARARNEVLILEQIIRDGTAENDKLDEDWSTLINLRGLRSISYRVDSSGREYPVFLFRVNYVYEHILYDLGDIEARFDPDLRSDDHRIAVRVRKASYLSWGDSEPNYTYGGGTFCFGDRGEEIHELRNSRHFVEALVCMDTCFHDIRDDQKVDIPKCFRELEVNYGQIDALDAFLKERGMII